MAARTTIDDDEREREQDDEGMGFAADDIIDGDDNETWRAAANLTRRGAANAAEERWPDDTLELIVGAARAGESLFLRFCERGS